MSSTVTPNGFDRIASSTSSTEVLEGSDTCATMLSQIERCLLSDSVFKRSILSSLSVLNPEDLTPALWAQIREKGKRLFGFQTPWVDLVKKFDPYLKPTPSASQGLPAQASPDQALPSTN